MRLADETAHRELDDLFDAALNPDIQCWQLGGDGSWTRGGDVDYQAERLRRINELAE